MTGRIQWAVSDPEITELDRTVEEMRAWDYPVEQITADAARRLEPAVRIGPGAEVWLWPSEGFVIPGLLVDWLLDRAESHGVEVVQEASVTGFVVRGGAVGGVRLAGGGSLEAERVVVCVGRWSEALLAEIGVRVPMPAAATGSPALGLLGYTGPTAARLRRTITGPGLNVRPDGMPGRFVLQGIGLDGFADPHVAPDPAGEIAGELVARARAILAGFGDAQRVHAGPPSRRARRPGGRSGDERGLAGRFPTGPLRRARRSRRGRGSTGPLTSDGDPLQWRALYSPGVS
jgi:glycine/D-amino acid oxidase-like deaminating enzyme